MNDRKWLPILAVAGLFAAVLGLSLFSPPETVLGQVFYYTPTADASGRVIYVVQEGDTCIGVALKNSMPLGDLRLLNDLSGDNCIVYPGQELLLVVIDEPTPMPDQATPTPLFPTPTPFEGFAEICVQLYHDVNGNGRRDSNEGLLGGGAVSITEPLRGESLTGNTQQGQSLCFSELLAGDYNLSVAVPEGYNNTTANTARVSMKAGDTTIVNFGAQQAVETLFQEENQQASGGGNSLLALAGGAMLLAGGGLGIYMSVTAKRRQNNF
jgi:hypothetical protein